MSKNYYAILDQNDFAIVDSGATGHYITETANVSKKKKTTKPIRVLLPDATSLQSTHECNLDIPLPKEATSCHIIPGMKNHSLISVIKLCEAGCKVLFSKDECIILHNGTEVMKGRKCKTNGLWYIPLNQKSTNTNFVIHDDTKLQANNVYHTTTMAETIQFLHQCLFSPTIDTLCKAIDNDKLIGFPHIIIY